MKHIALVILFAVSSLAASCGPRVPDDDDGGGVFCGGIAGIACPGAGRCADDPSDDCDPAHGGADCGGICQCVQTQLCVQDSHFDASPSVCACVPDGGEACGKTTCGAGTYCCNASCGMCVKPGMACIQIACD